MNVKFLNDGPVPETYQLDVNILRRVLGSLLSPDHPVISTFYWYTLNADLNFIGHFYNGGRGWKAFNGRSAFEVCAVVCLMRDPLQVGPFIDKAIAVVPDIEEVLWRLAGIPGEKGE
jgi:hypothetical protein